MNLFVTILNCNRLIKQINNFLKLATMIKLILQITKAILLAILALFATSCRYSIDVGGGKLTGNGHVVKEVRTINESFTGVEVSQGIEVIVEQGNPVFVEVETDENIQSHLKAEVKDGVLDIYSDENFRKTTIRKVFVRMPNVSSFDTSSGANLRTQNKISTENLSISTSSGSHVRAAIQAKNVSCDSSSGSHIELEGKGVSASLDSSSGSNISAQNLQVETATADASSGSSIDINVTENLTAEASSGASVNYVVEPKSKNVHASSGGSVRVK